MEIKTTLPRQKTPTAVRVQTLTKEVEEEAVFSMDEATSAVSNPEPASVGGKLAVVKAVRMDKRKQRLRPDAPPVGDVEKKKRVRERRKVKRAAEGPALVSAVESVTRYFNNQYLQMTLIPNVDEGYLWVQMRGLGLPMTPQQQDLIITQNAQRVGMGLPPMMEASLPWAQTGILNYAPVRQSLKDVGFEEFTNFFGDSNTLFFAMELSLAKELGLFRVDWVGATPVNDEDWANGGNGPYLASEGYGQFDAMDTSEDVEQGEGAAALEQELAEERAQYEEYLRGRLSRNPNTFALDSQLPIAKPTVQERGAGVLPPSVAAGNPGPEPLPPIPEGDGAQGVLISQGQMDRWADEVMCMANLNMARARNLILSLSELGYDPADTPATVDLRNRIFAAIEAGAYDTSETFYALQKRIDQFFESAIFPDCENLASRSPPPRPGAPSPVETVNDASYDRGGTGDPKSPMHPGYTPGSPAFSPMNPAPSEAIQLIVAADRLRLTTGKISSFGYIVDVYKELYNLAYTPAGVGKWPPAMDELHRQITSLVDMQAVYVRGMKHPSLWSWTSDCLDFLFSWPEVRKLVTFDLYDTGDGGPGRRRYKMKSLAQVKVDEASTVPQPASNNKDDEEEDARVAAIGRMEDGDESEDDEDDEDDESLAKRLAKLKSKKPSVRPTGPPDPPPDAASQARSLQQQQVDTIQKAAQMKKPAAAAYHPIVDYRERFGYKMIMEHNGGMLPAGLDPKDEVAVRKWVQFLLIPTVTQRKSYFYLRTDPMPVHSRVQDFFASKTIITDKQFIYNSPALPEGAYTPPWAPKNLFTLADADGGGMRVYSMQADQEQSMGFFGLQQLNHVFDHMMLKGKVMFSVADKKAIQFFPDEFVCSNVWWWESKLKFLPTSLYWKEIGKGSYNRAYKLLEPSATGDKLPDHFTVLPPTRVGYGLSLGQQGLEKLYAATKQNGLIKRVAYYDRSDDDYGLQRAIRESMLAGLASSMGFGPRIFATYIIPQKEVKGNLQDLQLAEVRMNPGDANFVFGDPLYRAVPAPEGEKPEPHHLPAPFYNRARRWDGKGRNGTALDSEATPLSLDGNFLSYQSAPYKKLVVVMEAYQDDLSKLRISDATDAQKNLYVEELWACMTKMAEGGILHGDIKPGNMVFRNWKDSDEANKPWTGIEIKAIDFDPFYVKLCPWLPWRVLLLINMACFLAFGRCNYPSNVLWIKMRGRMKKLFEEVNNKYPDGIAGAFRALKPVDDRTRGPETLPGMGEDFRNPRYPGGREANLSDDIYNLYNDEFEAARAFQFWVENYLARRCFKEGFQLREAPGPSSMLARLMAYIKDSKLKNAQIPADPARPGVFPFAASAAGTGACGGGVRVKGDDSSSSNSDSDSSSDEEGQDVDYGLGTGIVDPRPLWGGVKWGA